MNYQSAQNVLDKILAPVPMIEFFDRTVGQGVVKISGERESFRTSVLGPDPAESLLNAYESLAPGITCHAAEPLGPSPKAGPVADAQAFRDKIEAFHERGYTVRLNDIRHVSKALDEVMRALEFLLHQPVEAAAFWSRGDARAPVHHDDYDIIVIQLRGRKQWFVSTEPSDFPNAWSLPPNGPVVLGPHKQIDVGPGDLLYLPRGARHRVDAEAESIHISIGFIPLTMREAIIAALDHLSELDRPYRVSIGNHLARSVNGNAFGQLPGAVRDGVGRLLAACQSDAFVAGAMQRRSSRVVGDLNKLERPDARVPLSNTTLLRHASLAMVHLMQAGENIDFSYPGGHLYIHAGAAESVRFIAAHPQFRISDIPGGLDDATRMALVEQLLGVGFLVPA